MKKIISITFIIVITSIMLLSFIISDEEISKSERRELGIFPEFTWEAFLDGEYSEKVEAYLLDHMPFRENFRSLKVWTENHIFSKSDVNDIYLEDGHLFKIEYPYNSEMVDKFVEYVEGVAKKYFVGNEVYVAIIPDKNYYSSDNNLKLDYADMLGKVKEGEYKYIELFDTLSIGSYYKTDPHWKQEALWTVSRRLSDALGFDLRLGQGDYTINTYDVFYGAYAGQSAVKVEPETLTFLSLPSFNEVIVMNYEKSNEITVYNKQHLTHFDSYDVFLSGASALLEIDNPNAASERELVIFRDSFGSSITPLLIDSYAKIIMVDTRYVPYESLDQFVEFNENQDVLFLYSTLIVNNSIMLR